MLRNIMGGRYKSGNKNKLQSSILDDFYINNTMEQQDQYVDSKSTVGSGIEYGNRDVDRMNQMLEDQGLIDNSLDFIPGSKLSEMVRVGTSRDAAKLVGNSARKYGALTSHTVSPLGIAMDPRNLAPIVANIKESARGVPRALYDIGKGKNYKSNMPTEPGVIKSTMLSGSPNTRGFYANSSIGNWGDLPPTIALKSTSAPHVKGSILLHEKDHFDWDKKYGGFYNNNIKANEKLITNNDILQRDSYLGKPWEINARAKQLDDYYNQIKKNPKLAKKYKEDVDYLEYSLKPYLEEFSKTFPGEVGSKLFDKVKTRSGWRNNMGSGPGGMFQP